MTMKLFLFNFLSLLFLLKPVTASETRYNIQLFDSLLTEIIQTDVLGNGTDTLAIRQASKQDELMLYGTTFFTNILSERGIRVLRNYPAGLSFQGLVLDIADINFSVEYSEPYSKSFFGSDYCRRQVNLRFTGQLFDSVSGVVVKSIMTAKSYSDEIPYNDIEELELSSFSFTRGERTSYSDWDKIVEPVLVVGSVVIIVFLFFTQRA